MRKTFVYNLLFLLYIEFIFHIACFKEINILSVLLLLFLTIVFSIIITFITSLTKNEKLNNIMMKVMWIIIVIVYLSELIYYQIYESFFSINGLFFISAIKQGYDKVLLTIWQNILIILLLTVPIIISFFKIPKINPRVNILDTLVLCILLSISY